MGRVYGIVCSVGDYSVRDLDEGRSLGSSDLHGACNDAQGWVERLVRMGIDRGDLTVLCSPSGGKPARGADGPATRTNLLAAIAQLARRMARHPDSEGLLIVSGHGARGSLVQTVDGRVTARELRALLDVHLPDRGITAFLDICPVPGQQVERAPLRPVDLVMAASSTGHPAEEYRHDGSWHGAFTWAAHQVLDRWMGVGPHGSLVPISPRTLTEQASLMLQGLGFGQRPGVSGPAHRAEQGLLGAGGVRPAPLAAEVTRQMDPGKPDGFRVYDILDTGGSLLGNIYVLGPSYSAPNGWNNDREYWSIAPPSGTFRIALGSAACPAPRRTTSTSTSPSTPAAAPAPRP